MYCDKIVCTLLCAFFNFFGACEILVAPGMTQFTILLAQLPPEREINRVLKSVELRRHSKNDYAGAKQSLNRP